MFRRGQEQYQRRSSGIGFLLVYIVIGLYLINIPFQFLKVPQNVSEIIDQWIILVGGVLTILGGINHMRARK